jgi:hypothetical protein
VIGDRPGGSVLAVDVGAPPSGGPPWLRPVAARFVTFVAVGVLCGVVWWWLAPLARADVDQGSVFLRGHAELQAAQDCWFAIVLGAVGVLTATVHGWRSGGQPGGRGVLGRGRPRRGTAGQQVQELLALTVAMAGVSVLAWVTGSWLGPDDLAAQVAGGAQHPLTPLQLHSTAALLVGPFLFVFTAFLTALFGAGTDRPS